MTIAARQSKKGRSAKSSADARRYEEVASRVAALIDAGTLRVGDRIPSVREMSKQFGVAIGTVLHAYQLLEVRGRIEARPQSGYYVRPALPPLPEPRVSSPPAQAIRPTIGKMVVRMSMLSTDPEMVPLGGAIPSPDSLPTRQLNRLGAAAARRSKHGFNSYDMPPGNRELRVQVAKHYMEAGCTLSPDDLITTCGCQEALGLCLRAVAEPGDVIAVESPVYYGHLQTIEMLGLKALEIATDPREGVSLDALQTALKTRKIAACAFVPNCHNPLGFTMSTERKRALVQLLAKFDVPLIEDDIYGDISFAPHRPNVCKAFDGTGTVLLCSSFSKTLAPGARVGWCAPGVHFERVQQLKLCNTLATSTLPQLAIKEFLATGGYAHHLRRMRKRYADQVQDYACQIERRFPPGTRLTRPAGGYVLWVEMPPKVDAIELFERAIAMKINVAPGPLFSATGRFRNCIRLSCAYPRSPKIDWALQALGELARSVTTAGSR